MTTVYRELSLTLVVLDPTSTCDRDLDEHFRRSLGTDYDLIIRNKLEQEQFALQKQRMIEEQLLQVQQEAAMQTQRQQQQQTNILKHHKKNQIHQHQAMLAAKNSQAKTTPPTTPSPPIPTPAVAAVIPAATQQQVIITEQNDADEISVDDHFAKALGDKWKQFQGDSK